MNVFHQLLRRAHEGGVAEDLVLDNRIDEVEDDQEAHEHLRDVAFIQLVRGRTGGQHMIAQIRKTPRIRERNTNETRKQDAIRMNFCPPHIKYTLTSARYTLTCARLCPHTFFAAA